MMATKAPATSAAGMPSNIPFNEPFRMKIPVVEFFHQIIYDALCLRQLCLLPGELLPGFFVLRFQFLGLCFYSSKLFASSKYKINAVLTFRLYRLCH